MKKIMLRSNPPYKKRFSFWLSREVETKDPEIKNTAEQKSSIGIEDSAPEILFQVRKFARLVEDINNAERRSFL